jgi:hypothetical protein
MNLNFKTEITQSENVGITNGRIIKGEKVVKTKNTYMDRFEKNGIDRSRLLKNSSSNKTLVKMCTALAPSNQVTIMCLAAVGDFNYCLKTANISIDQFVASLNSYSENEVMLPTSCLCREDTIPNRKFIACNAMTCANILKKPALVSASHMFKTLCQ